MSIVADYIGYAWAVTICAVMYILVAIALFIDERFLFPRSRT